ncbi:MAG: hypothetical protein AVDCRST_MAG18-4429 [uncultured Thermomicrobiales bacterium]|uniref:Uncharacterized protein n=1 Tax=uncultured Thermomicrobiales bacterium TaxID=1645740 RepID=A0A6J4VUR5_9BACT|nr:MAG: hypothetical protein AVDCRST_MAG18-4429 [uncultured Thermomicrobiales bacterium]
MAVETTNVRRLGRLPSAARARDYGRVVLLSLIAAGGLAGLATLASRLTVTTGTILLFGLGEWHFWVAGMALACLVGALTARFAAVAPRDDALLPRVGSPVAPAMPILPAVATFGGVLLISIYHTTAMITIAPTFLALTLLAILIARYHLDDDLGRLRRAAGTAHLLLTHGVAFLALAAIYINKVRSLLSASLVAMIVFLLLVQIADGERFPTERRLIYGLVGGVILGEITWALNYWPLTGWTGGAVLLIAFYLVAGLLLAQVREGVRRRDLLEYGLGAAVMFAIVAGALWR